MIATAVGVLFCLAAVFLGMVSLALRGGKDSALPAYLTVSFAIAGAVLIALPRVLS